MRYGFKKWRSKRGSQQPDTEKDWKLLPLTPEFIASEHGGYLRALQEALTDPRIRNIALSGQYGVGKSSILQELARSRKGRVVELSLSTLAPLADEGLDDAVPKQAKTTTNRIQQEIVKQLLYREKPSKMPGSRFRRIERFSLPRELAFSGLAGTAMAVIGLLTGWTSQISATFGLKADMGAWSHGIVLALSVVAIGVVRWGLYGRIQVRQFSTGAATVTLDDQSVSYFDQYLDEIVYFFEVSKHNVVIFEDIDRFNDSRIFETLLALNTLLNTQRHSDNPIRFIYAIKDSIFDQSKLNADETRNVEKEIKGIKDPAQAETVRANRTKFFDLIIPVVPFITHRSAKNLAWKVLDGVDSDVDASLTDLAARYVPDMRLLLNIRNEFIVFRDRIFSGAGKDLKLRKTDLFAMVLYKCTHLADFEAISLGKSDIDKLYQAERNLVSNNIAFIQKEIRGIRNKLAKISQINKTSKLLGNKLLNHIKHTTRSSKLDLNNGYLWFNGTKFGQDDLLTNEFWLAFIQAPDDPVLVWKYQRTNQVGLEFPRSLLAEVLNNSLDPDDWNQDEEEELNALIVERLEDLAFLRQADMGDLIGRPEFRLEDHDENPKSLDAVARKLFEGDGLSYQLVRHGYINRNFTLYTATYHGNRVSAPAQNFIMLHVERDLMDEHFELDPLDVEGVLLECGPQSLGESALYNIAIMDYLLDRTDARADIMIRALVQFGDRERRFLQAYLNSASEQRASFIERFTAFTPDVLIILLNIELTEQDRWEFLSRALGSLRQDAEYRINKAVRAYLADHYAELPVLTSESIDADIASRIGKIFGLAGIQISALKPLTPQIQHAFVAHDCYELTRENLAIALESDTQLTLDRAKGISSRIYERILQDLPAYLSVIEGYSTSVESVSNFNSVIEDVLNADVEQLEDVIAHASNACMVETITEVSPDAWPHLAKQTRFPSTFANVNEYIGEFGNIDPGLAGLLEGAEVITHHESSTEEDKEALAEHILNTQNVLLSASSKVRLVTSLQLEQQINVERIHAEDGELFGMLVNAKVIADCAASYAYLFESGWPTREHFIEHSKKFQEYVTPNLLGEDLAPLLRSGRISDSIKNVIVDAADEYAEQSDGTGLAELARYAVQHSRILAPELLEKMTVSEVPTKYIVRLLYPNLNTMTYQQLAQMLNQLGEGYSALTSPGWDQPKFPDTEEHLALLNKVREEGQVVTKIKPTRGGKLKVWKRRRPD